MVAPNIPVGDEYTGSPLNGESRPSAGAMRNAKISGALMNPTAKPTLQTSIVQPAVALSCAPSKNPAPLYRDVTGYSLLSLRLA